MENSRENKSIKHYIYFDLDGEHLCSEDEIIKIHFAYWSEKMKSVNKEHLINRKNCIDDFVIVNWAEEIDIN